MQLPLTRSDPDYESMFQYTSQHLPVLRGLVGETQTAMVPKSGGKLLKMSHAAVVVWAVCMAVIATGNYLVTCMGVFTSCAVFPIYATLLWKRQNKIAIMCAPVLGSITALGSWLGSAYALEGSVTIATTSQILPLVIGNAASLLSGAVYL